MREIDKLLLLPSLGSIGSYAHVECQPRWWVRVCLVLSSCNDRSLALVAIVIETQFPMLGFADSSAMKSFLRFFRNIDNRQQVCNQIDGCSHSLYNILVQVTGSLEFLPGRFLPESAARHALLYILPYSAPTLSYLIACRSIVGE